MTTLWYMMKSQLNMSAHGDVTAAPGYADLRTRKSHLRHRKSDRKLLKVCI